MADHPPPVAPVFDGPLQADGKQSHFVGARGLCLAEGGGPPPAVPFDVPQPPCAVHAQPVQPCRQQVQQVNLGAEATHLPRRLPMPRALPATQGMASSGVQGLAADLPMPQALRAAQVI